MENSGNRTVLILATAFLIANFSWFLALKEMRHSPAANCTYRAGSMICAG